MLGSSDSTNAQLGSKSRKQRAWFNHFWQPADCCQSKLRKGSTDAVLASRYSVNYDSIPGGCSIAESICFRCSPLRPRRIPFRRGKWRVVCSSQPNLIYGERQPRGDVEGNVSASSAKQTESFAVVHASLPFSPSCLGLASG